MTADLDRARAVAEEFRDKRIIGTRLDGRFPLDVVFLADNILKLDLLSFPNLEGSIDASAAITPGLVEMYVDEFLYSSDGPTSPAWAKNRLRFSIAHEIGHIVLHPNLVPQIRCKDIADLKRLFNSCDPVRQAIETEANEFAGRLIVPRAKLEASLKAYREFLNEPHWMDRAENRLNFCELFGERVGLHATGVGVRLDREGLWMAEWTIGG